MIAIQQDGIECFIDENEISMSFAGESATFPLRGRNYEEFISGRFIAILLQNGTGNHYRLVSPLDDKLVYSNSNVPTMGFREAMEWKSRFRQRTQDTEYAWREHSLYAIMLFDEIAQDWLDSYMPSKRKSIKSDIRMEVYRKCDGRCAYCGKRIRYDEMQVDHVESHYRHKGKDEMDNFLPACRDCNLLKSDYLLEEFRNVLIPQCAKAKGSGMKARIARAYNLSPMKRQKILFYFEKIEKKSR